MLKLLVKLAIAALLANAGYRVGSEYLTHIKFRDAVRDAAMFKAKTDEELRHRIMDLSSEYEIPLSEDAVTIQREDRHVFIQGSYKKSIEVVPRLHYPWPFSWAIDAMTSTTVPLTRRNASGAPSPDLGFLIDVSRPMEQDLVLAIARFLLSNVFERVA